jgi:hypothetical protein
MVTEFVSVANMWTLTIYIFLFGPSLSRNFRYSDTLANIIRSSYVTECMNVIAFLFCGT